MRLNFRQGITAYHEQRAKDKAARAATKADKKAQPEKYGWKGFKAMLAAANETDRRRYKPSPEELAYLAENTSVIYVAQSNMLLIGYKSFNVAGLKTYVSLNGFLFHEVTGLPDFISRDFAREIASMGHESHDGKWRSPVTGSRYGLSWTKVGLMKPGSKNPGPFQGASGPQVEAIEQYLVGQPSASGPMRPSDIAQTPHLPGQILERVINYSL